MKKAINTTFGILAAISSVGLLVSAIDSDLSCMSISLIETAVFSFAFIRTSK